MNDESWIMTHFAFCDVPLSLTHAVDVLYDSNRFLADALLYLCLLRIQKDSPRKRMARTIPCKIRSSSYFWWSIRSMTVNGLTSRIALYGPARHKRFNIFDFRRLPLAYLCDSLLNIHFKHTNRGYRRSNHLEYVVKLHHGVLQACRYSSICSYFLRCSLTSKCTYDPHW